MHRLLTNITLVLLLPLVALAQTASPREAQQNEPRGVGTEIGAKFDWAARVNNGQAIAPLGDSIFGDQTSYYDGSTTFSITDVDLPGNSALPVRISRMHRASDPQGFPTTGFLGEWDLELPHVRGTYSQTAGWVVETATPTQRCSTSTFNRNPPAAVSADGGTFPPLQFWSGNTLSVPGAGDQMLLKRTPENLNVPTDAARYFWTTQNYWAIRCVPTLLNGPGEGFEAVSTDGTVYRFDYEVRRELKTLVQPNPNPMASDFRLFRDEVRFYASRVEDRFGNWVNYVFTNGLLTRIHTNDGREITLTHYASGIHVGLIHTVTANGRVWTYTYSNVERRLIKVELPDGRAWELTTTWLDLQYAPQIPPSRCVIPSVSDASPKSYTFKHPSGATGLFEFSPVRHARGPIPVGPRCESSSKKVEIGLVSSYYVYALSRKNLSGANMAALEWRLRYLDQTPGQLLRFAIITRPDLTVQNLRFGTTYYGDEGKLLVDEILSGGEGSPNLQATFMSYALNPANPPYARHVGLGPRTDSFSDEFQQAYATPLSSASTFRQGVGFVRTITTFDAFARSVAETQASQLKFSRAITQTFEDKFDAWVIGLPLVRTVNAIEESETQYNLDGLPKDEFRFGERRLSYTYNTDGTIATIKDGRDNVTTLSSWRRGLPQSVAFADTSIKTAVIDSNGWVSSITDEEGNTQSYGYDPLGRIESITYPAGWAATSRSFAPITAVEYGIPVGSWKQTIATGNYRKHVWFDALWRPILEREWDSTSTASATATQRFVKRGYDQRQNENFKSFAVGSLTTIGTLTAGVNRTFDALNRPVTESTPTELGTSTTSYAYLTNFETQITNPRGFQQRMKFQAFDEPSSDFPIDVQSGLNGPLAEQSTTAISRDVWGKVLSMTRSGNGASAVRTYLYDTEQRLCQLTEPESGALVMDYDDAGNLEWSAEGRSAQATCTTARNTVPTIERITRVYNTRNWLTSIDYPEVAGLPSPDAQNTYFRDGKLKTLNSGGANWTYTYNSLRKPQTETLSFNARTFGIAWGYDTLGVVSSLTYPNNEITSFEPNAIGQPTRSGSFATSATWHPSSAAASWVFGNGIVRTQTETARKLPDRIQDIGATTIFDEDLGYDTNANVITITDALNPAQTRTLAYDSQDRLKSASGIWGAGTMSYDGADNLKTQVIGAKSYTYNYSNQKLQTITDPNATLISFGYDARGNQTQKNGQGLDWDQASRIARANGKARYSYDGHGRRVLVQKLNASNQPTGSSTLQIYSQNGQLLYEEELSASGSGGDIIFANGFESAGTKVTTYHYLAKTLAAKNVTQNAVTTPTYLHTDVLGSVAAETDPQQGVTKRTSYQPYGMPSVPGQGPGYTGHVMDADTSLVYMQARYYDPDVGRFLSMDPKAPDEIDGSDFNRYAYARNNPYGYVDPDGKAASVAAIIGIATTAGGVISAGAYVISSDTPTLKGAGIAAATGAGVGAATAAVPALAAGGVLAFGGAGATTTVSIAAEFAAGAVGDIAGQALNSQAIDTGQSIFGGVANTVGLLLGGGAAPMAKTLTTTVVPGWAGVKYVSPSGKEFSVGFVPAREFPSESFQQSIQDTIGETTSSVIQEYNDSKEKKDGY